MTTDELNNPVPVEDNITPVQNPSAPEVFEEESSSPADAPKMGCCRRCEKEPPRGKLTSWNYLADVPGGFADSPYVEVQFKNTRKGYFINSDRLPLKQGDWVAVEAAPGHDIGQVTLTGRLVEQRMRRHSGKNDSEVRKVFRLARPSDFEVFKQAKARENEVMIRSRKIAASLNLNMKIGDVEFQGDGNKAIFYYIADERVDFRQLIKILAETFKVRIEMKQIGARQEAGRIGGIGPCGRPLCCASWMTRFVSVATSAARFQDLSLNPQKLAGQCAKLKCCLNFEVDTYVEQTKQLPERNIKLETEDATYHHFKTDIFRREITYSTERNSPVNLVTIDADRAFEIIEMNRNGQKPAQLPREGEEEPKTKQYNDLLDQDNVNRFDSKKKKKKRSKSSKQHDDNRSDKPANEANRPKEAERQEPSQQQPKQQESGQQEPGQQNTDRQQRDNRHRSADNRHRNRNQQRQGRQHHRDNRNNTSDKSNNDKPKQQ